MVTVGMYAFESRSMVAIGQETHYSERKTGAKRPESWERKKGAKGKDTVSTAANKDDKVNNSQFLTTYKVVNCETEALAVSKNGAKAEQKEETAESNGGTMLVTVPRMYAEVEMATWWQR